MAADKEAFGSSRPGESTCMHHYLKKKNSLTSQVKAEDLRWAVGCVVSENGSSLSPTLKKSLEENGYREVDFPAAQKAVQTSFPWRNTLSIYIAVMRVWKALVKYQTVRVSMSACSLFYNVGITLYS